MTKLVVLCLVLLGSPFASSQDTTTNTPTSEENIPFCDEVDNHPSVYSSPTASTPSSSSAGSETEAPIPHKEQHANAIQGLVSQLGGSAVEKEKVAFTESLSNSISELKSMKSRLEGRQKEIDDIYSNVLPSFETALDSRRKRAVTVRNQIKALNLKLRNLVDSLDRSGYVTEQQKFLTIIDALMRIQNTIELSSLGASPSATTRASATHPANNALLSVSQNTKPAPAVFHDESNVLDLLHALDLLQIETSSMEMPYSRRLALLSKKVTSILNRLIAMFNDLREKHKNFAKANREMWSKELDILQTQTDELSTSLESVMDQAEYYITSYEKSHQRLTMLIKDQMKGLEQYEAMQSRIQKAGKDYHELVTYRATQLKKLQELLHYLTYGNVPFTEDVFDFACDGVIGGTAVIDLCGVCSGNNSTCLDCAGVPNGPSKVDACGVCAGLGKSCDYFCDGSPNSGKILDLCGECGGNGTKCVGCDGIPNSGLVLDKCGICGGDGSSCNADGHPDQPAPAVSSNQVTVFVRIELQASTFEPDWAEKHGSGVRAAVASVMNLEASAVQIKSYDGTNPIRVDFNVVCDSTTASTTMTDLITVVGDGGLVKTLEANGVTISKALIVEGPSVITTLAA